jgi:hypothetical protein
MANVIVYGCVNWATGEVEFDTTCSFCADYTGCMVRDGGVHTGQIAVSVTTCGCSDTYYACVDWAGGGEFELSLPDSCIGFAHSSEVDMTFADIVDCENCVVDGMGNSHKLYGVDDYLNGNTFDVASQAEDPSYCWWFNEYSTSAITVRDWTTSNCTGSYSDWTANSVEFRLLRYATLLVVGVCVQSGIYKFPVLWNNNENDCCYQTLSNELGCGDTPTGIIGTACPYDCICENGTVDLSKHT